MHPNCRRGSLPNIRGSRLSAVPFCISILTSVRRIIKIAVRFLHTKTALCDRKDTQSRFAVNAARSIVCVETLLMKTFRNPLMSVSMPHAALCVSRHGKAPWYHRHLQVSMPHAALCVSRQNAGKCREFCEYVSMPHAALCVSRLDSLRWVFMNNPVSMPHAALCVSRHCVPQPLSRAG